MKKSNVNKDENRFMFEFLNFYSYFSFNVNKLQFPNSFITEYIVASFYTIYTISFAYDRGNPFKPIPYFSGPSIFFIISSYTSTCNIFLSLMLFLRANHISNTVI